MVYNNNKKGAQGIGTLIIFIALILVAAVAAGVLIQTASSLQSKADTTGKSVQQRIATGFTIVQVIANNTNNSVIDGGADQIAVTVTLAPGSDPIKLSDITLNLVSDYGSDSYSNGSAPSVSQFGVTDIKGDTSDGYINNADVATLAFLATAGTDIGENEEFTIRVFPGVGNPQPVDLLTPPSMVTPFTVLK